MMVDQNGNFQWASIAALIALVAAIISLINVYQTNRNNSKNMIAKSRIEWIQEVRKQSVEFISACYLLFKYIETLKGEGIFLEVDHDKRINSLNSDPELTKLRKNVKEKGTLLTLYFGPDSSKNNEFVNFMVTDITHKIDKLGVFYDVDHILHLDHNIVVLKDFFRIYFKAEWKRTNGGLKDSEIQSYLEKHYLYNKIMEIHEDGLETHREWVESYYSQFEK